MKDILQQLQSRIDKTSDAIAFAELIPSDYSKDEWKEIRMQQTLNKRLYAEIVDLRHVVSYYKKALVKLHARNIQLGNGLQLLWENTDEN